MKFSLCPALKVDRNYEYAIWISYAEIYNEKIFDLLGDASESSASTLSAGSPYLKSLTSSSSLAALSAGDPVCVRRKALPLKNDPAGGKFIGGLREMRVRNRDEARALLRVGQLGRRVFGTLANAASSRSHGVLTVRVVRVHGGDGDAHVSRLSIVDLAGSERTKHTLATGERLKEAGSINKSLMVLGQCMEALRANQRRLARPGLVPFRHSKLTELFQDFFVGEGRAVSAVVI